MCKILLVSCNRCLEVIQDDEEYFSHIQNWDVFGEVPPHDDLIELCRQCYEEVFAGVKKR